MLKEMHSISAIEDRILNTFDHVERILESFSKKIRNELAGKKECVVIKALRDLNKIKKIKELTINIKNKLRITNVL